MVLQYSTDSLFSLRSLASKVISIDLYNCLKSNGIWKNRGCRAGECTRTQPQPNNIVACDTIPAGRPACDDNHDLIPIEHIVGHRPTVHRAREERSRVLVNIPRVSQYTLKGAAVSCTLWNARSVDKKLPSVADSILANKTDIFVITETWFTASDSTIKSRFQSMMNGFHIHQIPRSRRKGGGVAVIVRSNMKLVSNKTSHFNTFEILDANIHVSSQVIRLVVMYSRPPSGNMSVFLTEFSSFLESVIHSKGRLLIVGDFNIHVDASDNVHSLKFLDLLHSLGLRQHVNVQTHNKGHTLDLIITRETDSLITSIDHNWLLPSDHASLHFTTNLCRPPAGKISRTSRKLKDIDINVLQERVKLSLSALHPSVPSPEPCVSDLVEQYNSELFTILDDLAPPVTKSFLDKPRVSWFSSQLLESRRDLRKLERKWRSTGLHVHLDIFKAAQGSYRKLVTKAHADYQREKITNADQKTLFGVIDTMIGSKKLITTILPDIAAVKLPDMFVTFFQSKILNIRQSLPVVLPTDHHQSTSIMFNAFEPVDDKFITDIIKKCPPKSSVLDPLPVVLLKQCIDEEVIPTITNIVNASLRSGKFPDDCKKAIVRPLLKKCNLDNNTFGNYRPISNLSFLSKLIEKSVFLQLNAYLNPFRP